METWHVTIYVLTNPHYGELNCYWYCYFQLYYCQCQCCYYSSVTTVTATTITTVKTDTTVTTVTVTTITTDTVKTVTATVNTVTNYYT